MIIIVISTFSGILALGLAVWFIESILIHLDDFIERKQCVRALRAASKLLSHLTNQERKEENIELPLFDMAILFTATDNFSNTNRIGGGGFGSMYKVICAILCILVIQKPFPKK